MDYLSDDIAYLEDTDFKGSDLIPSAGNNKIYVIAIIAEWCGHCKKFFPEYKKSAEKMNVNKNAVFCVINGTGGEPNKNIRQSEINLSKKIKDIVPGFRGFPTICVFINGKYKETFSGERTEKGIVDFVKKLE